MPAGAGIDDGGIEVGGAEVEVGAEEGAVVDASDGPLALALRVPGKVMMGSSRFEQFFFIYAKLMVGLRDSKVRESDTTPLAMHKVVISAGKPSR